ncbi:hypothetical protein A7982_12273 [Minicystis rosea]|nr:hypothetical protein A7982_12273 [Minicystis rosea]
MDGALEGHIVSQQGGQLIVSGKGSIDERPRLMAARVDMSPAHRRRHQDRR